MILMAALVTVAFRSSRVAFAVRRGESTLSLYAELLAG